MINPSTKDDIFDYLLSFASSAALGAALELGLFWLLDERPLDAAGVARALGIPASRCQYWLQLLESIGLVDQVAQGYAPSSTAQTAILDAYSQESWAFLAGEARERFPAVRDLALHIREPGSTWAAQDLTPPDYFAQMVDNPKRACTFTHMLYELHRSQARELAQVLDVTGVRQLMDLGGGSGVMSLALLRQHPSLTSIVVDIESVCVAGREIAAGHPAAERITYQAADFLHDDLPGACDMALLCDIGVYEQVFLRKIQAALNPGGRLVVVDQFAPAPGVAPAPRLHWAFLGALHNPDSADPTAGEIQARLTRAGFQLLSKSVLPGHWTVIETRKT